MPERLLHRPPSPRHAPGMAALMLGCLMLISHPGHAQPTAAQSTAAPATAAPATAGPASGAASTAPLPAHWGPAQLPHSHSFEIESANTGQRYRILIGLPHKAAPPAGYPVLWALDGLASFPIMTFTRPRPAAPHESAQWRSKIGDEPAGLIVAIGYASGEPIDVHGRALDYTPATTAVTGDAFSTRHGGADAFLRFLTQELRPLLARHFAMDPQRHTLFGFSYGGLFAVNTLLTEPAHFQRYWAASPSLWFGEHQLIRQLPQLPQRLAALHVGASPVRLMVTVGLDEQYPARFASEEAKKRLQARTMVDNATLLARTLEEAGAAGLQVSLQAVPAHDHHDMLMHGARRVIDFAFSP